MICPTPACLSARKAVSLSYLARKKNPSVKGFRRRPFGDKLDALRFGTGAVVGSIIETLFVDFRGAAERVTRRQTRQYRSMLVRYNKSDRWHQDMPSETVAMAPIATTVLVHSSWRSAQIQPLKLVGDGRRPSCNHATLSVTASRFCASVAVGYAEAADIRSENINSPVY